MTSAEKVSKTVGRLDADEVFNSLVDREQFLKVIKSVALTTDVQELNYGAFSHLNEELFEYPDKSVFSLTPYSFGAYDNFTDLLQTRQLI